MAIWIAMAATGIFVGGLYFISQQGSSGSKAGAPVITTSRTSTAVPQVQRPVSAPPPSTPPPSSTGGNGLLSPDQANAMRSLKANNQKAGVTSIAPLRLALTSCATCQPYLIYCTQPLKSASELRGRKVRAASAEGRALVQRAGGSPQVLAFADVPAALRTGIIDCSISGGGPLQ